MKGRKPLPTSLKILTGNPGKKRLPKNEPMPDSTLPEPPDHLDRYARDEWERMAHGLHGLGLLTSTDAGVFAAYCTAYSTWRQASEEIQRQNETGGPLSGLVIDGKVNPLIRLKRDAAADLVKYAAEFGMSPQARARVHVEQPKPKSKFDGLIGGCK